MPKSFTAAEIHRMLITDGWLVARQAGSHRHYMHPTRAGRVTLAIHGGDIRTGTLRSIFRQAGWKWPPR